MNESWNIDPTFRQEFLDFCELAAADEEVFKTFRDNDRVKTIIENSTKEYKDKTIRFIQRNGLEFYGLNLSPTEVRYYYTSVLITKTLSGDSLRNIVEIGGGYGGQCAVLSKFRKSESYTIYDLPQVQKLQARYLKDFNINPILPEGIPEAHKHDLLISWCAWSELDLKTRIEYVEKVISKADRFIICSNYNFYEDMGILASFGILPKVYSDELYSNILYYEK